MTNAWLPRIVAIAFSLLVVAGSVTELSAQQAAPAPAPSPGVALAARHPDVFKPGVDPYEAVYDEVAAIPFKGRNALKYGLLAALFAASVEVPVAAPLSKLVKDAAIAEGVKDIAEAAARGLVRSMKLTPEDRVRWELRVSGIKGATDFGMFVRDVAKVTGISTAELVVFGSGLPSTLLDLQDAAEATPDAAAELAASNSGSVQFLMALADGLTASECEYDAARLMLDRASTMRRELANATWTRLNRKYLLLFGRQPSVDGCGRTCRAPGVGQLLLGSKRVDHAAGHGCGHRRPAA
jgi:hypothetical protein